MGDLNFAGKVAVVTGGAGDIGAAHAMLLADRGAKVAILDYAVGPNGEVDRARYGGREVQVVNSINERGGTAIGLVCDVVNEDDVHRAIAEVHDRLGPIDVLINNAGASEGRDPVEEAHPKHLAVQLDLHLRGTLNVTRAAWPLMTRQRNGRILMTASSAIFGWQDKNGKSPASYSIAKSSLFGAMRQFALAGHEYGINVNLLLPWAYSRLFQTDENEGAEFTDWMRVNMRAQQVANGALFLLHDQCTATGEMFSIGGGRVARIVQATMEGYFNPDIAPEDVRDNWAKIAATPDEWVLINSLDAEWGLLQKLIDTQNARP